MTNNLKIVNPDNPVPKYIQISDWLKELIQTGRYQQGEKLPSELELSKMCGVNRNTLRHAISELVTVGMLRKEKGVGSFVQPHEQVAKHNTKQIASFRDYFGNDDIEEKSIVLEKGIEEPDRRIADLLVLGEKTPQVVVVKRLRTGDGIPYIYEESYMSFNTFSGILDTDLTGSMYQTITEKYGIVLERCHQTIRAINLDEKISTMFNLPVNSAGFYMEGITYDKNNMPVEVLFSYCRGDKYMFELDLGQYQLKKKINFFIDN